ncbi:MAG: hypothetical protein J2P22_01745 [Nocardioides sp.]|nr:hypothetical protein [Nocardioides sp.]
MTGTVGVPERRVVLHVGTMKSGTTSIQSLLFSQQSVLADRGVLALGNRWFAQVKGVRELIVHPDAPGRPWQKLVDQAREWDGTSVISMEFLGPFIPRRIEAAVASFGDLPVHVVLTMRDLNRTIPSLWQEAIQNGRSWSWTDYRSGTRDARPWQAAPPAEVTEPGRTFWRQQDAYRIVRRWAAAVGGERVSLVTLPPPGAPRHTLIERFGHAVGFAADDLVVTEPKNAALGAASAQMLQRVNARLAELGLADSDAPNVRKSLLAKQVLSARRAQEQGIGLEVHPWVVETADQMVERLKASGVHLVGEWTDLAPVAARGVDPEDTPGSELVAAAKDGFDGLRELLEGQHRTATLPQWPGPSDPKGAIEALAALVRAGASREDAA